MKDNYNHAERHQKAREAYMHLAAEFLSEESNRISLVTVTNAELAESLTHGTIFVTVFPEVEEAHVLSFLQRKGDDFKEYLKTHVKTRAIPNFKFKIDQAEKDRIRLDEILRESNKGKGGEKN